MRNIPAWNTHTFLSNPRFTLKGLHKTPWKALLIMIWIKATKALSHIFESSTAGRIALAFEIRDSVVCLGRATRDDHAGQYQQITIEHIGRCSMPTPHLAWWKACDGEITSREQNLSWEKVRAEYSRTD
jgi:hypothetical protein